MKDIRKAIAAPSQIAFTNFNEEIYLNALPHFIDRIDILEMDQSGDVFAYNFVENLLKELPFEMELEASFFTDEKLKHLYIDSRNKEKLKGAKSFGFGFPLFISRQEGFLTIAPIFIWSLGLEPSTKSANSWKVTLKDSANAKANPALLKLLKQNYPEDSFQLQQLPDTLALNADTLLATLNDLAATLCLDESYQHLSIAPGLSVDEIDTLSSTGAVHWSGVFGLFPPRVTETNKEVPSQLFQQELQSNDGHEFGVLDTDPYQASALKSIFRNKITVVDGEAGTGKTHLLLHLLSNALLNNKSCLVLSESVPALKELQERLSEIGINQFQFLLRDQYQDNVLFQELLKAAIAEAPEVAYDKDQLRIRLDKAERQKMRLDENFRTLNKNVFGAADWTEAVGLFLKSNRQEGKELLGSQLSNVDYNFTIDEFNQLKDAIETAHPLYEKINTLKHPLSNLHHGIFQDLDKETGHRFIDDHLGRFGEKAVRLQQRYINKLNAYTDALINHYDEVYRNQADELESLREKITDYANRHGKLFRESRRGALRFYSIFSAKHSAALEAKEEVARDYEALKKSHLDTKYFDFNFTVRSNEKEITKLEKELESFKYELESWRNHHATIIQEHVTRLSTKNVHYQLPYLEQVTELELALDNLVDEINEARLYEQRLENKMLTIPKRQKFLEEIIEQLESTKLNLRDFDAFYDWRRCWLNMSEKTQKMVRALIKVKPGNWTTALESWYLNNVLSRAYDPALLPEMDMVEDFYHNQAALKPLLSAHLQDHSQKRQDEAIKQLKRTDRESFNLLFGKKKEGQAYAPLRQLFDKSLQTIQDVLPILMTTPDVALNLMPDVEAAFDYVIIDEAQITSLYKAEGLFRLAKKLVLIGNSTQLTSRDLSIFGEAIAMGLKPYRLSNFHRYNPANLFQCEAPEIFEDNNLSFKVHFAQADGRFNEEEQTNEVEAQYIIRLLNQINRTPQRTFPTVGIACFTTRQRDLITDFLLTIKQKRSPGAEKIQHLERNGLGIYCIDELVGQHFDILLVSGTYGLIDSKGHVVDDIAWLNNGLGKALLNVLMGRTLKELFIINSLPLDELEALAQQKEKEGSFLLANYFLYARSKELNDKKSRAVITSRMAEYLHREPEIQSALTFRQELVSAMKPYLEPGRIDASYQNGLPPFPVLVNGITQDRPAILLWPDGFASDTYATDFRWEREKIQDLKNKGLIHLPVWTVNWWRSPENEARKLASAIIKIDSETEPISEENDIIT
jgi:KaiC/GvpD/RAD55 family RecA-like ATPase